MTTMASNLQFEKDHSELDPRALMDPQTSTGMPPVSGGYQRRIRHSTGVESADQARTRGMDPDGTSQPGRDLQWSCPGCDGKPGNTPVTPYVGKSFWGCLWGGGRVGGWVGFWWRSDWGWGFKIFKRKIDLLHFL